MQVFQQDPKMMMSWHFTVDGETTYDISNEVEAEIMAFAEQVLGNGQARIAISTPMDMKRFGNGAGASVTISLACNQDDNTINSVIDTLGKWTRHFAKQQCSIALDEFLALWQSRHPGVDPFA